jgi:hypothetical protein
MLSSNYRFMYKMQGCKHENEIPIFCSVYELILDKSSPVKSIAEDCCLMMMIAGQNPSTGPSRFKLKSQTPVTYPFALLKPYSAEGAVTLNDINKRLLSLPPRPVQGTIPIKERPLAQLGSGLSGKSVVACTKIHTEGNGTITIMRTKG